MTSEALGGQLQSCYTARARPQCESLQAIQRRDIRIIYPVTVGNFGMPYIFALSYAHIFTLVVKMLISGF